MAVRIYSLAKDLKVDSKELVDICTKAGVPGKGSALASLTEEEVEKVQAVPERRRHRQGEAGEGRAGGAAATDRAGARRQDAGDRHVEAGRCRRASEASAKTIEPDEADEPRRRAGSRSKPPIARSFDGSRKRAAVRRNVPPPWSAGRRDGPRRYIGPGAASGKVPVVGAEAEPASATASRRRGTPQRPRPAVKLAPMPKTRPPKPVSRPLDEPPAQKPDCDCRPTCWAPASSGSKPLAAHLRRHEDALETAKRASERQGSRARRRDAAQGAPRQGKPRPRQGKAGGRRRRADAGRPRTAATRAAPHDADRRRRRSPHPRSAPHRRRSAPAPARPRRARSASSIQLPCTVRELSEAAGVPAAEILRILMNEGVMTTHQRVMDPE